MNNEIFHEDFTTIMNEEKNYRELKERKVREKALIILLGKLQKCKTILLYC